MFCPKCRAEFREGFTRCSGCECDLVREEDLPPDPASQGNGLSPLGYCEIIRPESWDDACLEEGVMIFETLDPVLAESAEKLLDENKIPFAVRNRERATEISSAIFGSVSRIAFEPAQVFVFPDDKFEARSLLADFQAASANAGGAFSELPPELAQATDEPDPETEHETFCPWCGTALNCSGADLVGCRFICPKCGKVVTR